MAACTKQTVAHTFMHYHLLYHIHLCIMVQNHFAYNVDVINATWSCPKGQRLADLNTEHCRVREINHADWFAVDPRTTTPLWPYSQMCKNTVARTSTGCCGLPRVLFFLTSTCTHGSILNRTVCCFTALIVGLLSLVLLAVLFHFCSPKRSNADNQSRRKSKQHGVR